ncbi:MAG: prepilin-type N-terminal cleavage/methylation domain-containing protein [Gammaproteobacteria bacterium]|nr:MAG: prepilin-type N-terminal cleavage/methylation domain-containing protein [Gammaproteobacteria bacterium]
MSRRQPGFSLIEAMVALVLLVGGLAIAVHLLVASARSAGTDQAMSVALGLAQEKTDDLRDYEVLPTTTGKIAYQDISDNAGGQIASGTSMVFGTAFTRTWTVSNWYFPVAEGVATTTVPSPAPSYPDFKQVTVSVTWRDEKNELRSVALTSMIPRIDPMFSRRALAYP